MTQSAWLRTTSSVALVSIIAISSSLIAATPHDGNYAVEVTTDRGSCDKAKRIPLSVTNSRITALAGLPMTAVGEISAAGAVSLVIVYKGEQARVTGHMNGGSGGGTWSSKPTICEGRWRAERFG